MGEGSLLRHRRSLALVHNLLVLAVYVPWFSVSFSFGHIHSRQCPVFVVPNTISGGSYTITSTASFSSSSSSMRRPIRGRALGGTWLLLCKSGEETDSETSSSPLRSQSPRRRNKLRESWSRAVEDGFGTRAKNVASTMAEGDVVVPICGNLDLRSAMAARGVYAGVEYQVCEQVDDVTFTIQPAYALRAHLERSDWPVEVDVTEIPLWLSASTYTVATALSTLALALTNLGVAALTAWLAVRLVILPPSSESMLPTVTPGDVVVFVRSLPIPGPLAPKVGDVVLFQPPSELGKVLADLPGASPPAPGQQLLKRVVAVPGDRVGVVDSNPVVAVSSPSSKNSKSMLKKKDVVGPYAHPELFPSSSWNRPFLESEPLGPHEYFVAGDNGARSVDSRVWGPLRDEYIFGTARWIVYPFNHFGPLRSGNFVEEEVGQEAVTVEPPTAPQANSNLK